MDMNKEQNLNDYAKDIASLTCEMERVCRAKETLFCESINITPVEFRCLRYLINNSFAQVKELAHNMDLTPSRVTSLLNGLEKNHYIKREISKKDRRIIKIVLTKEGEEFAVETQNHYINFHVQILESVEDKSKLEDMLRNLNTFKETLEGFLKKN
jgi:DNA-binding MarR family transcriptional regulator